MRIDLVNQSKYRSGSRLGDDIPLILPGQVFGVFDGATDPHGTIVDGNGTGRLAALTAAHHTAQLTAQPGIQEITTKQFIDSVSSALNQRTQPLDLPIPPSTTLAVAVDCGDTWRFITLGDSGIRLNGSEILIHEKLIDDVSTVARVAIFDILKDHHDTLDDVEISTRKAIFLGLDQAVHSKFLSRRKADDIIINTISITDLHNDAETVETFLNGGIQTQFRYGNTTGSPLSYDTINGTQTTLHQVRDVRRPKDEIRSIEIFSDGYSNRPKAVSLADWERAFHHVEAVDFHKIGAFASVKGATSAEFFDDRTVLILSTP